MTGRRRRIGWAGLAALAIVAGIAVQAGHSLADGPNSRPYRVTVPMVTMDPAPASPPQAPPVPAGTGAKQFVLNEVMFAPVNGAAQFVELRNAGEADASTAGLTIKSSAGKSYNLTSGSAAPGGVVLVLFDGREGIEGTTVHASPASFLALDGWVELDGDGGLLDKVAWGHGQPGAVNVGGGGRVPSHIEGLSIGRPPGAVNRRPEGWTSYRAAQVTPALPNPAPTVSAMMPLDGAILHSGPVALAWYSVTGASSYRLQIAADETFASVAAVRTVQGDPNRGLDTVSTTIDGLTSGTYFWHVQVVSPDGATSQFSAAAKLTISSAVSATAAATVKLLPVPLIMQHKDTSMLWLEGKDETGPKAWDGIWPWPSGGYCARASIAMVNAFYGGKLSQDRISYELFKDVAPGPEHDLALNKGLQDPEIEAGLKFALKAAPLARGFVTMSDWVAAISAEIDQGRPVVATTNAHAFVVIGYGRNADGSFAYLTINDPAAGRYDFGPGLNAGPSGDFLDTFFLMPPTPDALSDEPELAKDSDGDGVNDFDETKRFHTNPNAKDSDQDGVNDKQEISASVFDPKHGYSTGAAHDGRDFDHDGLAMELDPDSDNGGCQDGKEDLDGNGKFDSKTETYNFDPGDDACAGGTYHSHLDTVRTDFGDGVYSVSIDLAATFSFSVANDGQLTGTASVIYWIEGRGVGASSCPLVEQPRATVSWTGQVTGAITDGYIGFHVTPERGPKFGMVTSGCGIEFTTQEEPVGFAGYGQLKLTDGRYDEHVDYPLVGDATVFYSDLHISNHAK